MCSAFLDLGNSVRLGDGNGVSARGGPFDGGCGRGRGTPRPSGRGRSAKAAAVREVWGQGRLRSARASSHISRASGAGRRGVCPPSGHRFGYGPGLLVQGVFSTSALLSDVVLAQRAERTDSRGGPVASSSLRPTARPPNENCSPDDSKNGASLTDEPSGSSIRSTCDELVQVAASAKLFPPFACPNEIARKDETQQPGDGAVPRVRRRGGHRSEQAHDDE